MAIPPPSQWRGGCKALPKCRTWKCTHRWGGSFLILLENTIFRFHVAFQGCTSLEMILAIASKNTSPSARSRSAIWEYLWDNHPGIYYSISAHPFKVQFLRWCFDDPTRIFFVPYWWWSNPMNQWIWLKNRLIYRNSSIEFQGRRLRVPAQAISAAAQEAAEVVVFCMRLLVPKRRNIFDNQTLRLL